MNKLPKDKRDKIILVCLGTVAAVGGIWFAMIAMQREVLANVRKAKIEAEQKVNKGKAILNTEKATAAEYDQVSVRLKGCEVAMAAPNDMYSWLIQTLNTFRMGYQVDIPQFSRETPAEVWMFAKFPYRAASFTVRGSAYYHDFGKFLADFENAFPYIRVQNLELEPMGDQAASVATREKLTFKMDLLTLVRPIAP